MAGNGPKQHVQVCGRRVVTTMDSCRIDAATYVPTVRWEVLVDYRPVKSLDTKEAAVSWAESFYSGPSYQPLVISDSVATTFVD
jgi:hypothetical protein